MQAKLPDSSWHASKCPHSPAHPFLLPSCCYAMYHEHCFIHQKAAWVHTPLRLSCLFPLFVKETRRSSCDYNCKFQYSCCLSPRRTRICKTRQSNRDCLYDATRSSSNCTCSALYAASCYWPTLVWWNPSVYSVMRQDNTACRDSTLG